MNETVINYVVEFSEDGSRWLTWPGGGTEPEARAVYAGVLASKRARGGRLGFRLVKRTAVITDEVLESEDQEART